MRKKVLYVVHRYAPFPGGSENYVRNMAEETLHRGHEVWVLAGEHKGDLNGVRVTKNPFILLKKWDLIVVHGGDLPVQKNPIVRLTLESAKRLKSPMLLMLIIPSDSRIYQRATRAVKYVGCSTTEDWELVERENLLPKSVQIRHSIDEKVSIGMPGFRAKYGIETKYMFLSCGGYWPNKAMRELVSLFDRVDREDITLVLTGYDNRYNLMPEESKFVKPFMIDDRNDVISAILEADLYVMHSHREGFGLVLLESMLNKTPWAARNLAGAKLMNKFGFAYDTDEQLLDYMKTFSGAPQKQIEDAYIYVTSNHLVQNTVDDILQLTLTS
ncbi:glycosyltransferase family 4 protein [Altericista sp. CCNU0014]|uniref:glycosyltransferase family 4 protein n=1 Tax=Altericista sp. CCNU0014 TaxID=3082949 RepID=UPI00384B81D6